MKGEQIHVRIAVEPPRRTGRKPGTRLRPAPVRGDSADRNAEVAAQALRHIEAGGREGADRLWPRGCPGDRLGEIGRRRSEEHTSQIQSPRRTSYSLVCLKKQKQNSSPGTAS